MDVFEFDLESCALIEEEMLHADLPFKVPSFSSYDFCDEADQALEALDRFSLFRITQKGYARVLFSGAMELMVRSLPEAFTPKINRRLVLHDWLSMISLDQPVDVPPARDHVFHPPAVATMGWWILHERRDSDGRPAIETIAGFLDNAYSGASFCFGLNDSDDWKLVVQRAWILAGLLHDITYPFELLGRHGHSLAGAYGGILRNFIPRSEFPPTLRHKMEIGPNVLARTTSIVHMEHKLSKPHDKHSHAVLGAAFLLDLVDHVADDISKAAAYLAAEAILIHHIDDWNLFENSPLGFLLATCDWMQEWGRVLICPLPPNKVGNLTVSTGIPCLAVSVSSGSDVRTSEKLEVEFQIEKSSDRLKRYRERFLWSKDKFINLKREELPTISDPGMWGLPQMVL